MTKDEILKKYEDDNEYHFHQVDREWIMEAMQDYADKQLRLYGVVGQSEQLVCVVDYLSNFTKGKMYECKPDGKNHFEVYDDFGDWYSVHKKCFNLTKVAN